jgi:hypothetical protein
MHNDAFYIYVYTILALFKIRAYIGTGRFRKQIYRCIFEKNKSKGRLFPLGYCSVVF